MQSLCASLHFFTMSLGNLNKEVLERRASIGSELFAILDSDFEKKKIFQQITSIRVKVLSNTNLAASRHTEGQGLTSSWPALLKNVVAWSHLTFTHSLRFKSQVYVFVIIIFIMLYLCIFCHYHFCCRFIYCYLTKETRTMFVTIKKRKLGPSILLLFPGNYLKQDTQNWNEKIMASPRPENPFFSAWKYIEIHRITEAVYIRRVLKNSLIYYVNNLE